VLEGGVDAATLWLRHAPARCPPCAAGAAASTLGQRHAVCLSVMIARLMALASKTIHIHYTHTYARGGYFFFFLPPFAAAFFSFLAPPTPSGGRMPRVLWYQLRRSESML